MPAEIDVHDFVSLMGHRPVVDVRTSAEFERGHIPGAESFPLFSNEERAEIGIMYKKLGRLRATQAGLEMVGPRLNAMLDSFRSNVPAGDVLVHCWRGGMRSQSVAWLMDLTGEYSPAVLRGGYKAYRNFALAEFDAPRQISIIGGMTGTGKTHVISALMDAGAQTVDLEGLASHRGSAFGSIGQPDEPTQQQFENDLALELHGCDRTTPVWLEDESRHIGRRTIPDGLWRQMREARVFVIERSREERVAFLMEDYGESDPDLLVASIKKIERRLGGARADSAIQAVRSGDLETACNHVLDYYDRTYAHGVGKRDPGTVTRIDVSGKSHSEVAGLLSTL